MAMLLGGRVVRKPADEEKKKKKRQRAPLISLVQNIDGVNRQREVFNPLSVALNLNDQHSLYIRAVFALVFTVFMKKPG